MYDTLLGLHVFFEEEKSCLIRRQDLQKLDVPEDKITQYRHEKSSLSTRSLIEFDRLRWRHEGGDPFATISCATSAHFRIARLARCLFHITPNETMTSKSSRGINASSLLYKRAK